jgi:beta-lactamase regulating signal transducer with metallopeptidase domain
MTFALRTVVLTLASIGVAALLTSVVVALIWRTPEGAAAQRAGRLWRMRLLPAAVALATSVFVIIGLWRFEGRHNDEYVGWIVRLSAVVGAMFLMAIVARLVRMHLETRHLLSAWLNNATRFDCPEVSGLPRLTVPAYRIDTHFPVVAVVGIMRPTLVVDATVLDGCSPQELSAILAHEHGHLHRWDNLRRAVFAATPDLLAWTTIGPALRDAWREATEEAADDVAAATGEDARMHLAGALIHVARIAQCTDLAASSTFRATQLPASALYRGESIERRVRRLLAPDEPGTPTRRHWSAAIITATVVLAFALQSEIHDLMEVAVNNLW